MFERNQDATLYVGNISEECSEAILWELFTQAGPVSNVHMPKDRVTGNHQGYGFVEFKGEEDADYAMKVMNMVKLYGKPLRVSKASAHNQKDKDIGANIFVGNISLEADEKSLYDLFSQFGNILKTIRIMESHSSRYAFISFDSFASSDKAIETMNGLHFFNQPITVSYAYKKDSHERHGGFVERVLEARRTGSTQISGMNLP